MKSVLQALVAAGIIILAASLVRSRPSAGERADGLAGLAAEDRKPVTHGRLNNDSTEFQFAIVSDRTGGHRPRIFSQAVERLNLLQPEFVLSVGDLIEGGNKTPQQLAAEWEEFDGYVARLKMPFFYVPGNHDTGNAATDEFWRARFGRRWYHFVYRDVLFLCLNTDDPPGSGAGTLGQEQIEYAKKALAENRQVRWTIVALHKPIWTGANLEKRGWLDVEKALADRPYTVFCGHIHHYQKFVRQGRNYYQLATTGGGSKLRGVPYGEFDHLVWVTMKKTGPVLANVMLDAILDEELKHPESNEGGVSTASRRPTHPVRGYVYFDGAPVAGAQVVFQSADGGGRRGVRADAITEGDGSFLLSTYTAHDGVPVGEYGATVVWRKPFLTEAGRPGPNQLPERYARAETSGLRFTVKEGKSDFTVELKR